jgi:hypothetical protein
MRKIIALALVAGCTALMADGNSSSASADAKVQIVAPITVSNVFADKLDFGQIVVNDATKAMSVVMAPDTAVLGTFVNCVRKNNSAGTNAAWFHIAKDQDIAWGGVNIKVDPTVDMGKGAKITPATGGLTSCTAGIPGAAPHTDQAHFNVGGKLEVPAGVFGFLTGKLNVTVAYN